MRLRPALTSGAKAKRMPIQTLSMVKRNVGYTLSLLMVSVGRLKDGSWHESKNIPESFAVILQNT